MEHGGRTYKEEEMWMVRRVDDPINIVVGPLFVPNNFGGNQRILSSNRGRGALNNAGHNSGWNEQRTRYNSRGKRALNSVGHHSSWDNQTIRGNNRCGHRFEQRASIAVGVNQACRESVFSRLGEAGHHITKQQQSHLGVVVKQHVKPRFASADHIEFGQQQRGQQAKLPVKQRLGVASQGVNNQQQGIKLKKMAQQRLDDKKLKIQIYQQRKNSQQSFRNGTDSTPGGSGQPARVAVNMPTRFFFNKTKKVIKIDKNTLDHELEAYMQGKEPRIVDKASLDDEIDLYMRHGELKPQESSDPVAFDASQGPNQGLDEDQTDEAVAYLSTDGSLIEDTQSRAVSNGTDSTTEGSGQPADMAATTSKRFAQHTKTELVDIDNSTLYHELNALVEQKKSKKIGSASLDDELDLYMIQRKPKPQGSPDQDVFDASQEWDEHQMEVCLDGEVDEDVLDLDTDESLGDIESMTPTPDIPLVETGNHVPVAKECVTTGNFVEMFKFLEKDMRHIVDLDFE